MLQLKNIKKSYKTGNFLQHALKGINLEFRKSEFVSILGPSGSGKTTLLNIIGGLDKYDSGDLIINGKSTKKFKPSDWDSYRNNCIGFIFQSYNLISHISVLENVEMCMTLSGISHKKRKRKALEVLKKVGLKEHAHKKPNQLSGGQMQRVAIARALANNPDIILADEPTGALDSETSIQIMNLIKEISKDKLVIMVTHNPQLASEYSNRIVEFKDGSVLSDSNPVENEEITEKYNIKKTAMSYKTALNLSFKNIITKKGRTLITAFASSIGIIGIALILSLSNGFNIQIDNFERETLSQMPIAITPEAMVKDEEEIKEVTNNMMNKEVEYDTDSNKIYPLKSVTSLIHENHIDTEYEDYINKIDQKLIGGIAYQRATKINLLYKQKDEIELLDSSSLMFPLPENINGEVDSVINENFDLIYGKMPENESEIVLLIDTKNRLDEKILKILGYKEENIDFTDILNKEFKVVLNNDLYKKVNGYYIQNNDYKKLYENKSNLKLKISGIIRGKKGNKFAEYSGTGLCYKESLMDFIIENNSDSEIVKEQKKAKYNVMTGEKIDLSNKEEQKIYHTLLAFLGAEEAPNTIQIYPKNFEAKEEIIEYLDKYNENKEEKDKILYTDYAKAITSLSGNIMNAVTIVLVAFSAISLVVSSIMIGIITYISVLERTKEIGVLRALGARKKDITRVFNAETFIIGLVSGILGLGLTRLLIIPANIIIENLTELKHVARLNPTHAIILLIISLLLTVIGGFIPAKVAAKKDPVEALRSE